jgi:hypothetical protein
MLLSDADAAAEPAAGSCRFSPATFRGTLWAAAGMTVGIDAGGSVEGTTVVQASVSLLKVTHCSQSVTVTSGTPSGVMVVEQIALTVGAKRTWQPASSRTSRASASVSSDGSTPDVLEMAVTLLEKTVEEPFGSRAVALTVSPVVDDEG